MSELGVAPTRLAVGLEPPSAPGAAAPHAPIPRSRETKWVPRLPAHRPAIRLTKNWGENGVGRRPRQAVVPPANSFSASTWSAPSFSGGSNSPGHYTQAVELGQQGVYAFRIL